MQHTPADKNQPKTPRTQPARAASEAPANPLTAYQQSVISLQKTIGNAAVQRLLHPDTARPTIIPAPATATRIARDPEVPNPPPWSEEDATVRTVQRDLRRLGLYHLRIDGDYGPGTDAAMVEAFGGDEFRTLGAAETQTRLAAAEPPPGRRGEHEFRYGEMFKDGVLDMTLGLGYDEALESGDRNVEVDQMTQVLESRGFAEDQALAARIYRQAGRTLGPSAFGKFFVKENALTYTPPAGPPREIHAVVRLVANPEGTHGAEAASAFREGMAQSDTTYYSGHGRYGSGPDFDRNFGRFDLLDAEGNITQSILDYDVLERVLRQEGRRHGRGAWAQFLWRHRNNRINVELSNAGNLYLNPRNLHRGEFGGRLIYWALEQEGGGAELQTGEGGAIDQAVEQEDERRYRVVVFNGCRTQDYERSIRSTPGMDDRSTELITTRQTVYGDETVWNTLAAYLDSIIGQQSAEETVRGMEQQQEDNPAQGGIFRRSGSRYDPRTR